MNTATTDVLAHVIADLVADAEVPPEFITTTVENGGAYGPYTQVVIALPDADATELFVVEDDTDVIVTRRTGSGVVLDEVRLRNPRFPILRGVITAFTAEALAD